MKGLSALRCFASKTAERFLFTDLRDEAAWQATIVDIQNFIDNARHFGIEPPLCSIEGWTSFALFWDVMHNLYIGIGRDLCGSAIARLIELEFYSKSNDVDVHLAVFSEECRKWSHAHAVGVYPPNLDHLSLGMAETTDKLKGCTFPELDAKAAHVKLYMMFLASELFIATCALDDYELRTVSVCMYHGAHMIHTMQSASFVLKPWESDLLYQHGTKFLITYRYLARLTLCVGKRRYRLRPKLHYIHHTLLDALTWPVNPGFLTCFLDEDFMGKVKSIASKCHKRQVSARTLQRYKIILTRRWRLINLRSKRKRGVKIVNRRMHAVGSDGT